MPDARDWLDALTRAWRVERAAVRAKVARERSGRTLGERVALGIAIDRLRIVDEQSAPGDRVRVRVAAPESIDLDNLRLSPGDPIRLWAEHPDEPGAVRGVYERRDDQSVWLMLDRSVDELDRDYAIDSEAPEVTFDRGDQAIARAHAALATSDLARIRDVAALVKPPRPIAPVTWTAFDDALDERQLAAVAAALRAGDIALIHGPPGTGKTRTLVEVVRQRVARGERVLCAAPSNTAVDNLGVRLADAGLRAVRLGHPARVNPALATLTLDAQVDADGATRLARDWRDRARQLRRTAFGKRGPEAKALWQEARALDRDAAHELANAERAIVGRAQVVLATCVGCDHFLLGQTGEATAFDCVIVDEATQAPDPLLLIALARAKVCVLAGDPQQLGPVVTGGPAAEATLGSTIFERLARVSALDGAAASVPAIGFLANTRRMNVALTRARRFLLVVADSATLGDHPYYAAFLSYVDEIDAHGSAWSDDAPPL